MSELLPTTYLIGGPPRTAKSTVSNRLARHFYGQGGKIVEADTDDLRALFNVYPELRIGYTDSPPMSEVIPAFRPSLEQYTGRIVVASHATLVLHGDAIDPYMAADLRHQRPTRSCFMGMNDPRAAFERVREHEAPDDWTTQETDEKLLELLGFFVLHSLALQEVCDKLDLRYIDATRDVPAAADQAYDYFMKPYPNYQSRTT